jgi:anthranilate synthase component I
VAPTVRSFSAEFDPLRLISQYPDCYPGILESGSRVALETGALSLPSEDSRFDILPITNGQSLRLDARGVLHGSCAEHAGFLAGLQAWCAELAQPVDASAAAAAQLPFRGGWLVYLSYEIAAEVEPRLRLPGSGDAFAGIALRAPAAWIRDRRTQRAWLIAEPGAEDLLTRFETHVAACNELQPLLPLLLHIEEEDPACFIGRVERALQYIAAGDIYQANLSRPWQARATRVLDPAAPTLVRFALCCASVSSPWSVPHRNAWS